MGLMNFFKETTSELKHVSWPSRKQTIVYTALVIIISVAVSLYLGFFDFAFVNIIKNFFVS
ncbi:MAG TPA: preprotein translocase subunit SecE [Candidatus Paceibacterota bacterium]|nr:preprotein translocase subunit SecE [Candidatus Paceibacterota bacterium]HRZ34190.1 preprotein translocase subunit SecE [Candidatus Paceibacterota bacterium]